MHCLIGQLPNKLDKLANMNSTFRWLLIFPGSDWLLPVVELAKSALSGYFGVTLPRLTAPFRSRAVGVVFATLIVVAMAYLAYVGESSLFVRINFALTGVVALGATFVRYSGDV